MAKIVGLDIGTRTITGAVFTGSAKRYRLADFFVEEIPGLEEAGEAAPGEEMVLPPALWEVLKKVLEARGLGDADVVAAVDAKDAILREITVPFTKDEHIKRTITAEAENHFQTFDIEDVVLEYLKIEEVGEKSRLLIAAVRKGVIKDRLDLLKQAGVDPLSLDLDVAALYNAYLQSRSFDPERTALLVDMGAASARVILVEKGRWKKARAVRMGSHRAIVERLLAQPAEREGAAARPALIPAAASIDARFQEIEQALRRLDPTSGGAEGLSLDDEPIAILTDEEFDLVQDETAPGDIASRPATPRGAAGRSEGGAAAGPASAAAGTMPPPPREFRYEDYLQRLGIEIQRTFAASALGSGLDLICITGGLSRREEAKRYFSEEFGVETVSLDLRDAFPMDLVGDAPETLGQVGAVAVGLALKEFGGDRVGFDFRKREFRFERKFERIKYPILALAALFFLVSLNWAFVLWNNHLFYANRILELRKKEEVKYKEFFKEGNSSQFLFPQAENKRKAWERLLGVGGANVPVFVPFVDALDQVTKAVEDTRAQPRVESFDLKLKTRNNKGKLASEASSSMTLTSTQPGLGTLLEKTFGQQPKQVFEAGATDNSRGNTGKFQINVNLTFSEKYLGELLKAK